MYTTVDDLRIHYALEGQGTDLILIHGLGGSLHDWDTLAPLRLPAIIVSCGGMYADSVNLISPQVRTPRNFLLVIWLDCAVL